MIYTIKRGSADLVKIKPTGWQIRQAMGVNQVEMNFTLLEPVLFQKGDWCNVYGDRYKVINSVPFKKYNNRRYEYTLKMVHESYSLQDTKLKAPDANSDLKILRFAYMGDAAAHLTLLLLNLNEKDPGWTIGVVDATIAKNIMYDGENLLQVLNRLASEFDTEYWIENKTIHLTKRTGSCGITLGYGRNKGLLNLTKSNKDDSATIFTRLFVEGGSSNLPTGYRNGAKALQMPAGVPYIQDDNLVELYGGENGGGIIEGFQAFDDIYPKRIGTISSVTDEYTFSDAGIDFDVNDQLLPSTTPKIIFQTGLLAGYQFEISSFNNSTKTFVINEIEEKSTDEGVLPTPTLKPAAGDQYIVIDIQMPSSYVANAELELQYAAQEYYLKGSDIEFNDKYQGDCDPLYFKRHAIEPILGYTARILESSPAIDVDKRMATIKRDLQNPWKYEIDFTDKIELSALARTYAENKRTTQLIAGVSISGGTGSGTGGVPSFLGTLSGSDGYLYISGIKAKAGYADTAQDAIHAYDADRAVVATTARQVQSLDYESGDLFGTGHKLGPTPNGSLLEVDNVVVRKEALFNTVTIKETKWVNGAQAISSGATKIKDVEVLSDRYRCYIETDSGTIGVPFQLSDFIRHQVFDGQKAKFYVGMCIGVGADYFDLAKTMVDGIGIPQARDEVFQAGNLTDTTRQGIIYDSAYGSNSPNRSIYAGVNSINWENKLIARDGDITGVNSAEWGILNGMGKYAKGNIYYENVNISGVLRLKAGSNAYTKEETETYVDQAILEAVEEIADDGIVRAKEKTSLKILYDAAANEVEDLKTTAASLGVSSVAYNSAFYSGLQPVVAFLLSNMDVDSPVDKAQLTNAFNSYAVQKSLLEKNIKAAQKTLADVAQSSANTANNKIDNLKVANENLLDDSSFERARTIFSLTTGGGFIYDVERSTDYSFNGTHSFKATVLKVTASGITRLITTTSTENGTNINYLLPLLSKVKGRECVYSIRVKAVGSAIGKQVSLIRSSNPGGDIYSNLFTLTGEWQTLGMNFEVPSDSTSLAMAFNSSNTLAVGDVIYFDCDFFGIGNKAPEGWIASDADVIARTAKLITLSGTTQIIAVSKEGVNTPASPFTVTGAAQNTTITEWQYSIDGGSYSATLPTGVTRSGDVVTITPATVTFKTLTIRGSDGTYSDVFTVARAIDGQDGAAGIGYSLIGSVATYSALPTTGLSEGDGYMTSDTGKLYVYRGGAFPIEAEGVLIRGVAGQDGYSVILANENHTFPGSETAALPGNTVCNVIAYKGATSIAATVTVGALPTGLTASVSGTQITFTASSALTTPGGIVDVTIVADGKTFVMPFSYSISFKGATGEQGIPGTPGADGITYYTWMKFADTPTTGMSDSGTGKEYIGLAYNKLSPTESTNYADYTWTKTKGEQGDQGVPGAPGADGQTTYTWLKYSDFADGTGLYDVPTENTKYIGLAINKTTPTESTIKTDYVWSLFKGADGADAPLLYLSSTAETMVFDAAGSPTPASQTITFEAKLQNISGTATFSAIPYIGAAAQTAIVLGGSGNTRTLTQAQWSANVDRVVVTATLGSLTDVITIVRLQHGATGAAGQDGYTILLSNENHTFPGSATAAIAGSAQSQVIAYKGATAITPTSITVGTLPTGMTASVSGTTITFNVTTALVSAGGTVIVTIVADGKTFPLPFTYTISFKGLDVPYLEAWGWGTGGVPAKSGVWKNGINVAVGTRGHNVVVFDKNFNHVETQRFDTYNTANIASLITYVESLVDKVVCISTHDAFNENTDLNILFQNLGGSKYKPVLSYRMSYALIGLSKDDSGNWQMQPGEASENWNATNQTTCSTIAYKGGNGIVSNGVDGAAGISVTGVDVEFAVNTNPTVAPTTGWVTTTPTLSAGQQLWTRTKTSYSSGSPTYSNPVNITPQTGATGSVGTGVASITEEYYLSTSKATQTGGSWVTTPPTWVQGQYIWTRVKIVYNNPSSTVYTTPIVSSEWEAVNNIQIGGVNLLNNSAVVSMAPNNTGLGTSVLMTDEAEQYRRATPDVDKSVSLYGGLYAYEIGKEYICSIWVRQNSGSSKTIRFYISGYGVSETQTELASGAWTRIITKSFSAINNTSQNFILALQTANGATLDYKKAQIENANKASTWQESPADTLAKITAAQTAATNAAKTYADAQDILRKTETQAYADGKVTVEEAARIAADTAYLNAAKAYAEAEDAALQTTVNAYADGVATSAENAAIVAAQAYANLKKAEAEAYADGIVDTEEAARIADVQAKYLAAKALADAAQDTADAANDGVSDINNPDKLTPSKKQQMQIEYNEVYQEYTALQSQANNLGVSYSSLQIAYNAYVGYVNSNSLLTNLTVTSNYNGATYRTNLSNYNYQRDWLRSSISNELKTRAVNALSVAGAAQTAATGAATNASNSLDLSDRLGEALKALGDSAFQSFVEAAMNGEALAIAGYLKNTLIDTVWLNAAIVTAVNLYATSVQASIVTASFVESLNVTAKRIRTANANRRIELLDTDNTLAIYNENGDKALEMAYNSAVSDKYYYIEINGFFNANTFVGSNRTQNYSAYNSGSYDSRTGAQGDFTNGFPRGHDWRLRQLVSSGRYRYWFRYMTHGVKVGNPDEELDSYYGVILPSTTVYDKGIITGDLTVAGKMKTSVFDHRGVGAPNEGWSTVNVINGNFTLPLPFDIVSGSPVYQKSKLDKVSIGSEIILCNRNTGGVASYISTDPSGSYILSKAGTYVSNIILSAGQTACFKLFNDNTETVRWLEVWRVS